jgi:hypothetical protein
MCKNKFLGGRNMSFLTIIAILIVGIAILLIGFATKKKCLKILSIIPIAIALVQLGYLVLMGL